MPTGRAVRVVHRLAAVLSGDSRCSPYISSTCHALIALMLRGTDLSSLQSPAEGASAPAPNPYVDNTYQEGLGESGPLLPLDPSVTENMFTKAGSLLLRHVKLYRSNDCVSWLIPDRGTACCALWLWPHARMHTHAHPSCSASLANGAYASRWST